MSRNLIILIIIFAVLIGLAMFVLIPGRNNDEGVVEGVDPLVAAAETATAQAVAGGAAGAAPLPGRTTASRDIDGRSVVLNYLPERQFVTESERSGFAGVVAPEPTTIPDPATTVVVEQQAPTLTPVPQVGAPQVGRAGDPIIFMQYTVGPSDTMYGLSQRTDFRTSIGLMALYGIDTSDFTAGKVLNLPIVNPNYCSNARATHLILEGETVFRIADKYGTTIETIRDANGLGADFRIRTNDVLCIP